MPDVTVLRALTEVDNSALEAGIAKANRLVEDFGKKSFGSPRLTITDNTGAVRTRISELDRETDRFLKKARRLDISANLPKNLARDLKEVADVLPRIKSTSATITLNRAGNLDIKELRMVESVTSKLQDKSVTVTTNFQQTGTPPPNVPGGGNAPSLSPRGQTQRKSWSARMDAMQSRGYSDVAGGAILSGAFTAPLVAGGAAVTKFASDFQESMQHVVTLTDVSKGELAGLSKAVLQLSDDPRIRQGPIELAEALYYVTSTGLKGAEGMKVLHASALGASAGLGETKTVANTVTTVLDAYGLSADKASRVVDTLTEAVRKGKGEASQYAAAFPKVIAIAAQAGVSFEEVAAQMASATRLGLTPSESATALRQLFNNIIDPSEKAKKAMKEMGTSVGELRIMLNQKGLFNTLKDLQERTGGRIGPLTELFGNIRALTSFLSTTGNATLAEYQKTLKGIENASGSTARSAGTASETLAFQMDRLQAAMQRALIETGEAALPRLTPLVEMVGKSLPAAVSTAVKAWDALSPSVKTAIVALGGALALSGPLKMLGGTIQILVSALGGIAAIGSLGPGGWLALGALALAAGLAAGKLADLKEQMDEAANEADTLARSVESVNKHLKAMTTVSGGAATATKNALRKLSDDAVAAGDDTKKLIAVIKEAVAVKVAVGKDTHLDPAGKAVVSNEIDRLIADLSARTINLKVNLDKDGNVVPGFVAQVEAAAGKNTPGASQASWQQRAKAAGVAFPAMPSQRIREARGTGRGGVSYVEHDNPNYASDLANYNQRVAEAKSRIEALENSQHKGATATHAATVALNEQTKAVTELKDAELARERARLTKIGSVPGAFTTGSANFNADAYTRYGKVVEESDKRKAQIQATWAAQKDADKERATQEAENRVKAEEETARRLRDIEAKSLSERLQLWNSFGNAVEGLVKNLGTVGAEKTDTARWAAEAQMARREFEGIPKPLRDVVIGLGAINDAMKALTGQRDSLRATFEEMYKGAIRSGASLTPIKEAAAFMEKRLDYENRMKTLYQRGAQGSKTVLDAVEGQRASLSSRQEALQEAGRTAGAVYSEAGVGGNAATSIMQGIARQFDGAQTVSACALVAGKMMKAVGINIPQTNSAAGLRRNAIAMGAREIPMSQAKAGDLINWVGAKYGAGGSGNHVGVYEGGGFYSGNHGGKNKNPMALHEKVSDLAHAHFYNTSDFARGANPVANTKPGEMPASTAQSGVPVFPSPSQVGAPHNVPALPVKGARAYNAPHTPAYDGSLLGMALPKGWGKQVTEYGMAPGETRSWRLKIQEALLNTKEANKGAAALHMSLDEYAAMWRRIAENNDAGDAVTKAHEGMRGKVRDLGKSSDLARSGRSGPISEFLYDAGRGDYNRTPANDRNAYLDAMVNNSLAQSAASTREFTRSQEGRNKVLAAGRPFLQGAATDIAAYERAMAMAQKRVEAWNELQGKRDDIASLWGAARAAGQKGDVKGVVRDTEAARRLQSQHDQDFKQRVDGAEDEYDSGNWQKASADVAARLVTARKEGELLDFERGLIGKGMKNAEDRARLVEMERIRRETVEHLTDSLGTKPAPFQQWFIDNQAKDVADAEGKNKDTATTIKTGDENDLYNKTTALRQKMLAAQLGTAGQYASDNPELAIQLRLLEERNRLETENLTRVEGARVNVDERLQSIEAEIRAEEVLKRYQTERGNLLEAQNNVLDQQKQNELALAQTAREKLAIEWKYTDMARARVGITTSPEEVGARDQQADAAAEGERQAKYKSEAENMAGVFRDAMSDGLSQGLDKGFLGFGKRIFQMMQQAELEKISRRIMGLPDDPNAQSAGGIWGMVTGKGKERAPKTSGPKAPSGGDLLSRISGITGAMGLPTFTPDARAVPTMPGGSAGAAIIQTMSAQSVVITTVSTEVRGQTVNVAQGAGFLPTGARAFGGGSGSSSLLGEILGSIA